MSIVDDLVKNLISQNSIKLTGAFTITLIDGGLALTGKVDSSLRDKNKELLKLSAPINARVTVGDIVIPVPQIR
jgi:hypothetical protein